MSVEQVFPHFSLKETGPKCFSLMATWK